MPPSSYGLNQSVINQPAALGYGEGGSHRRGRRSTAGIEGSEADAIAVDGIVEMVARRLVESEGSTASRSSSYTTSSHS